MSIANNYASGYGCRQDSSHGETKEPVSKKIITTKSLTDGCLAWKSHLLITMAWPPKGSTPLIHDGTQDDSLIKLNNFPMRVVRLQGYMYKMYNIACYITIINKNNNSLNQYPILPLRGLLLSTSRPTQSYCGGHSIQEKAPTRWICTGPIRPRSTLPGAKTNWFICRA
jgi:hypothetical protein